MTDSQKATPQFNTAEYGSKPGVNICRSCNQPVSGAYYRVNGALACPNCAQQLKRQIPKDSHSLFARAVFFGFGGAILGLILYATFAIATGWVIGYLSLAVGYIVGKALLMGSGGIGGRRYQIAAVLLTYFAVSVAAIPVAISQYAKQSKERPQIGVHSSSSRPTTSPAAQGDNGTGGSSQPESAATQLGDPAKPKPSVGAVLGVLLLVGLASPFLALNDPLHGGIGLVILFVGMNIAWKLTAGKKVDILGPFGEPAVPAPLG